MIVCPWCGTQYRDFQPNCKNCGGPLHIRAEEMAAAVTTEDLPYPPPAPRAISENYIWKLLGGDGWWITALVFGLLGLIFCLVGGPLTLAIITAFVGLPFLLLGILFLGAGSAVFFWRYQEMMKVVRVLREGQLAAGKITQVVENTAVSVNGRHPWRIDYTYHASGQTFTGRVSTLNPPNQHLQEGKSARILYLPDEPQISSLYPHP